MAIPIWGIIPFVIMLACIAVLPLMPKLHHYWERNIVKLAVALILGIPTAAWIWFGFEHGAELVEHSMLEYVQFITLLFSLFVVSGGIFLAGDIHAMPRNNTILLAVGGLLASFIGTTGAAMLLIRPILNSNRERENKVHTVVFAILIVANCGGMLTPLGDPPLYLGLMRGVPFTWTFSLFPMWLFINGLLLLLYYAIDRVQYAKESEFALSWNEQVETPLRVRGGTNIIWLLVIIASVAFLGEFIWIKIAVQLGAAVASYLITNKQIRFDDNEFSWAPILEVAALFIGIFLTMIPALEYLREHAAQLPLNIYTLFVFTGSLSSVLDNAPTYLTFFEMSTQLSVPGDILVAGVPQSYLLSISLAAVACGAITYIGNGPNFMVKTVAEERGVEMPSFGGYVIWTFKYLVPILVAMVCIFLSSELIVKIIGAVIAVGIVVWAVFMIVKNPLPHRRVKQEAA
ncbi:MAG: sodium:proton antiporter [Propionibacteriaceae bacterium]|nr:sodium:proton antiporter [Propionibacteriaceae bacterium]